MHKPNQRSNAQAKLKIKCITKVSITGVSFKLKFSWELVFHLIKVLRKKVNVFFSCRKSLCCKMAREFDFFIDSNKR